MTFPLNKESRIFIAGHEGMVGSAIHRLLINNGFENITIANRQDLELTDHKSVCSFFKRNDFEVVIIAAARVGGLLANTRYPVEFLSENLLIQTNIINESFNNQIESILFLGSSCIYPKDANQPMNESQLLTGVLQPNNEPYAIAKIAGIKLCESYNRQYDMDYRSVMPTNLYGPNDNYHSENSHVMPALIRRFHEAKINNQDSVRVWGTGMPRREFLHVNDMADACLHIMSISKDEYNKHIDPMVSHINIGSGHEITIKDLASIISEVVGFEGQIIFDDAFPDGVDKKLLDVTKLSDLGWEYKISLKEGVHQTYKHYRNNPVRK